MKLKTWLLVLGASLVVVGGGLVLLIPKPVAGSLESISTALAPWPAEEDHLKARLAAIKQPALSAEGTALHIHQHLDVFVHGQPVPVPANIGVHESLPIFISPIHVHDTTGIIHVESPTIEKFYLGQFFDIWSVRFSDSCIGGYCSDATNTLKVFVNGQPYTGDPRQLELTAHEEIVITYGTDAEVPGTIPAAYSFPPNY